MAEKNYVLVFEGREYRICEAQHDAIQKLRVAIHSIAEGATAAAVVIEGDHHERIRSFYFSPDPAHLDMLGVGLEGMKTYLARQAVLTQGNAPPASRSLTIQ